MEICQNGIVIWAGKQILNNPATSASPLALAVPFDAGLTEATLSYIVCEFLSHLNGEGKKVLFRPSQLYSMWHITAYQGRAWGFGVASQLCYRHCL